MYSENLFPLTILYNTANMKKNNYVVIVNKNGEELGKEEKLRAHQLGKLHLAFSVFIFNKKGELLLQRRSLGKYHSAGLWSNTCCSHPRPGFNIKEEAVRRLKEEMGIEAELKEIFSFIYKAKVEKLIEYEFDHIFLGKFNGEPKINKKEVGDWRWASFSELKRDIRKNPQKYTPWFKKIIKKDDPKFKAVLKTY